MATFCAEDRLDFAIVAHLKAKAAGNVELEQAVELLEKALPVAQSPANARPELSYATPLLILFEAGVEATGSTTLALSRKNLTSDPTFQSLLSNLTSRGFFNNVEEGSAEYEERFEKVVQQYERRRTAAEAKAKEGGAAPEAAPSQPAPEPAPTETAPSPVDATDAPEVPLSTELQQNADALKASGNNKLKAGDYDGAIELYTAALELIPEGPQSHIYLSNRAAAYCHLKDYASAVEDCRQAVELKDDYAKAHARMGFAYFYQENYPRAEDCYSRAADLEPENQNHQEYLRKVRAKLSRTAPASSARGTPGAPAVPTGGAAGQPDLANIMSMMGGGGGAGGPGGFAGLMQNPQMMQMAQQMMSNPEMMRMAQDMMADPNAMANMMGALGGAGGAPGGDDTSGSGAGST